MLVLFRQWIFAIGLVATVNSLECDCPKGIRPICGTDNTTYRNLCYLRCAQQFKHDLQFYHNGSCCRSMPCENDHKPLCDSQGKTHQNECRFHQMKCLYEKINGILLEIVHEGECEQHSCSMDCNDIYDPVCDTDGASYHNLCQFKRFQCQSADMSVRLADDVKFCLHNRVAQESTYIFYPSQEVYAESYSNEEYQVQPIEHQPAPVYQECDLSECEKTWNPVCDRNNRTHRNLCYFKYYACKLNQIDGSSVDIAHAGPCYTQSITCQSCPLNEPAIPLCDNMNMTHADLCSFIQFNCMLRNQRQDERVLVHIKPCHDRSPSFDLKEEICPVTCSRDVRPVCDEANNTHQNLCHFQQYNCNMRKLGIRAPYLRYLRPCIKNRKIDTAVEQITISSTVTQQTTKPGQTETKASSNLEEDQREVSEEMKHLENERTTISEQDQTTQEPIDNSTSTIIDGASFDCPKPSCPIDGQPVCDSNGNLHGNLCEFTYSRCLAASRGEQLRIASEDNCVSEAACQMSCTDEEHPVCASDLNTYDNLCLFRKQKCADASIEVLFRGRCNECFDEPCAHPAYDAPDDSFVCVEDGSTKSLCEYQMLSCIFEKGYGLNLTIQYVGKCCPKPDTCADELAKPICASNGVTYASKCEFDIENCKNLKLEVEPLEISEQAVCERGGMWNEADEEQNLGIDFKRENTFNCSMECDKSYDPLCATNGITYTNACQLQKEICDDKNNTIEIAYPGVCCETTCPNDFSPVCDSHGNSHQNICHFGVKRCIAERTSGDVMTIDKFDVCKKVAECEMSCPKEYSPICASNGQNIINECELERMNCLIRNNVTSGDLIIKDYDGECCRETDCQLDFSPVCDSEGVTHANECILKVKSCIAQKKFNKTVTMEHEGQCCYQQCEDVDEPVCDGENSHKNVCSFKIAQCEAARVNKTLSIAYSGECCQTPKGDCETSGPICDSDGQTHDTHCLYQHRKCIASQMLKKNLTIVHTGECCVLSTCTKDDEPICDSNGVTHESLCHFHNAKCIYDKIHRQESTLNIDYHGKCCPADCSDELNVVCDQNGNVYRNSCYFNWKACQNFRRTKGLLIATTCPIRKN